MVMVYAHLSNEIVGSATANIEKVWHKSGTVPNMPLPSDVAEIRMDIGAGNEARTRDPNLGKVVLYH
jgi:hypothetical protein